jgi:hypothetical protein
MQTENELLNKNTDCSICSSNISGDDVKIVIKIKKRHRKPRKVYANGDYNNVYFEPINKNLIS